MLIIDETRKAVVVSISIKVLARNFPLRRWVVCFVIVAYEIISLRLL